MLELIFPKICKICGKKGEEICKFCMKQIRPHQSICFLCKKSSIDYRSCEECYLKTNIRGVIICFEYNTVIKKLIINLKYKHKFSIASFLSKKIRLLIMSILSLQCLQNDELILGSVPSHRFKKFFIRGYNQSELLAKNVSIETGIEYCDIFKKIIYTKSQVNLSKKNRAKNLSNSYILNKNLNEKVKKILIIDDIITTGSTIIELSKNIKKQYSNIEVWGCVIARNTN